MQSLNMDLSFHIKGNFFFINKENEKILIKFCIFFYIKIRTMGIVNYMVIGKRDNVEVYKTAWVTTSTAGEIFIYLKK